MQSSTLTPDDLCPYLLTPSPLVWVGSENTMDITPIIMLFYVSVKIMEMFCKCT